MSEKTTRILIVEDEPASELILRQALSGIAPNVQFTRCDNAEEALVRLYSGDRFDLAVVDIFLAGKVDGIALYRACCEHFPQTPVLVTSSLTLLEFLVTIGRNTVAPTFLEKPLKIDECRRAALSMLALPPRS